MKYRVKHTTQYSYAELVPLCHNAIRLQPRDTDRQTCQDCEISITPEPSAIRDRVDFFGNHVKWVSLQEPHQGLDIVAKSEVDVTPFALPDGMQGPAWDLVPDRLASRRAPAAIWAEQYTFDSPYVPRCVELADYARPSFTPQRPILEAVSDLTQRIFHEFTFDTGATTVGTPVLDVLRHRHGVCQDFAHLEIGCLRSLGLAARYVSGYLVTRPPPGKRRLVGADASHAWVSVYVPEFGWVDFDPTNGVIPSGEHVTLGWARDYDDIAPVKGVITGGHRHWLSVAVDVEPATAEEVAK